METENLPANPYRTPSLEHPQGAEWKAARHRAHRQHAARLEAAASSSPQQVASIPGCPNVGDVGTEATKAAPETKPIVG